MTTILESVGAFESSQRAETDALLRRVAPSPDGLLPTDHDRLVTHGTLLEGEALITDGDEGRQRRESLFASAFSCWRDVISRGEVVALDGEVLPPRLSIAFHAAVTGSLAARTTEVHHVLSEALPAADVLAAEPRNDEDWASAVLEDAVLAAVLLTRKQGGWADVAHALQLLDSLRDRQAAFEAKYLEGHEDGRMAAVDLVAIYHLAQLSMVAGTFLRTGASSDGRGSAGVLARLGTHRSQAIDAATISQRGDLARIARLLHLLLESTVRRSIWAHAERLGQRTRQLVANLAAASNEKPTLELWPSQSSVMQQNFLDTFRRAVVVQMPTSAGKTLLAKFAVVQAQALNPDATVAYIVPTRVLVNQITDELRSDFRPLGLKVEQAVPIFDLSPTEDDLLSDPPNVLVTTPEKLDLLIRRDHPSLRNLSLVVVDEAHNLADESRGARLELILATIKRDRPNASYLLLSPFLPNAAELVDWLGDAEGEPIQVDWRPNQRIVGALKARKVTNKNWHLELEAVPVASSSNLPPNTTVDLGPTPRPASLKAISVQTSKLFASRGAMLIICAGKPTAVERSKEIAATRPTKKLSDFGEAVIKHVTTELGTGNALSQVLRHGVAYHHAGLSQETRRLVELLMRDGEIDIICGTSTLAQGVNFPIATVIVESRRKGRSEMTYSDFWNMAGRAGRGLMSDLGIVAYPVHKEEQADSWNAFFRGEAEAIASQLSQVVLNADSIDRSFSRGSIRGTQSLSEFLQYLAHAYRVSGSINAANEVEDLLRSSLIFRQAERASSDGAERLIRLCREYLASLSQSKSLVTLADGTGFSTSTVRGLLGDVSTHPELRSVSSWEPTVLFGEDIGPLTTRIQLIADLPEMSLAEDGGGIFNAQLVAEIIRGWSNGKSLRELADSFYAHRVKTDEQKRLVQFSGYLNSQLSTLASWGLGTLQRVALAGQGDEMVAGEASHIPSMVLFGVNTKEAVWLRMAGLPREAAFGAANVWRDQAKDAPKSFTELRDWVSTMSPSAWSSATDGLEISGPEMQLLWSRLHAN